MKISARNRLKGKITEVKKGATTAHVRLDVNGTTVTASITNEAVDELGLKVGQTACSATVRSGMINRTPARDRPGALGWRRGS